MEYRLATINDSPLLAELNHQLIRDEGHRNPMTVPELELRMRDWLANGYQAVIYQDAGEVVAYALYNEQSQYIHLRHLFVVRHRRRQGIGLKVVKSLRSQIWPQGKRLTVDVLVANERGVAFWRAAGYKDYCMTLEILPDSSMPAKDKPVIS